MNGQYTFIFLTNESGILKEPLLNRCIQFIFENYTEQELKYMIESFLPGKVSPEIINSIYRRSKGNPRIANMICKRLSYMAVTYSTEEIENLLDDVISIDSNGLNYQDLKYLEFLEKVGGRAGLDLISNATHLDKNTILREIEPGLIYLGKIRISSRGRELC
jgi:Holliday junction resolvasome RuvABC ATP-dependent DNA helicase subunit